MSSAREFYDDLAAGYHLIYPDWDETLRRQGAAVAGLIAAALGDGPSEVLDCACGIGTQAIGLALAGHRVVGTDLSPLAVRRARDEAAARGVRLPVAAADMTSLPVRTASVDAVVCMDNALAHLLDEATVAVALAELRRVLRPSGLLVVSTRSDLARREHPRHTPLLRTDTADGTAVSFQLWDWESDGEHYAMRHVQLLPAGDAFTVRVRRTRSWAITPEQVDRLVRAAGFTDVAWPDVEGVHQPVLTARR